MRHATIQVFKGDASQRYDYFRLRALVKSDFRTITKQAKFRTQGHERQHMARPSRKVVQYFPFRHSTYQPGYQMLPKHVQKRHAAFSFLG